jgi:hypothetical protein
MKGTIYETITNQIVSAIEEGASLYRMPWHRSRTDITNPRNADTRRSYRGFNIITLWMVAETRGYGSGVWGTYRQWQERGCQVRKGEKAAPVFFWKSLRGCEEASEQEDERPLFVARGYSVFNAEQVESYVAPVVPILSDEERIAQAEASSFRRAHPLKVEAFRLVRGARRESRHAASSRRRPGFAVRTSWSRLTPIGMVGALALVVVDNLAPSTLDGASIVGGPSIPSIFVTQGVGLILTGLDRRQATLSIVPGPSDLM